MKVRDDVLTYQVDAKFDKRSGITVDSKREIQSSYAHVLFSAVASHARNYGTIDHAFTHRK